MLGLGLAVYGDGIPWGIPVLFKGFLVLPPPFCSPPSLPSHVVAVGHCTHISYTTSWVRARLSLLLSWWCGVWFRAYVAVVVASFYNICGVWGCLCLGASACADDGGCANTSVLLGHHDDDDGDDSFLIFLCKMATFCSSSWLR